MTIPLIKLASKRHDAAARQPFNPAQVLAREAPGRGNEPGEDILARSESVVRVPLMSIKDGWQC